MLQTLNLAVLLILSFSCHFWYSQTPKVTWPQISLIAAIRAAYTKKNLDGEGLGSGIKRSTVPSSLLPSPTTAPTPPPPCLDRPWLSEPVRRLIYSNIYSKLLLRAGYKWVCIHSSRSFTHVSCHQIGTFLADHVATPFKLAVTAARFRHLNSVISPVTTDVLAVIYASWSNIAHSALGSFCSFGQIAYAVVGRRFQIHQVSDIRPYVPPEAVSSWSFRKEPACFSSQWYLHCYVEFVTEIISDDAEVL